MAVRCQPGNPRDWLEGSFSMLWIMRYELCNYYGLHRLQGTYPILMTSSLLPVYISLFFSFI